MGSDWRIRKSFRERAGRLGGGAGAVKSRKWSRYFVDGFFHDYPTCFGVHLILRHYYFGSLLLDRDPDEFLCIV